MLNKTVSTFVLAILVIASFSAVSQTTPKGNKPVKTAAPPPEEEQSKSNGPEIKFYKLVHDYGTILEGSDGECEFEFKNIGKEPLVLSNVHASCGCTVPTWPKEPIMPGKTAVIKVKYATSRIGGINKTITVNSNAEENPKIELRIQGTVKSKQEETLPDKQESPMQQSKP
jgi:hypothetical protein